jgi:hypothetical protein
MFLSGSQQNDAVGKLHVERHYNLYSCTNSSVIEQRDRCTCGTEDKFLRNSVRKTEEEGEEEEVKEE